MITIKSVVYPDAITDRLARLTCVKAAIGSNAVGKEANFSCGSYIRFSLVIDVETSIVADAAIASNGCGFMLAAADVLAESMVGQHLTDLRGQTDKLLSDSVTGNLGEMPSERRECVNACIGSLRSAFAEFRTRQIEEFRGEEALICTCFGVSEKTIERQIAALALETVDDVARHCNAGSGCGSCRMLIQEMIDNSELIGAGN